MLRLDVEIYNLRARFDQVGHFATAMGHQGEEARTLEIVLGAPVSILRLAFEDALRLPGSRRSTARHPQVSHRGQKASRGLEITSREPRHRTCGLGRGPRETDKLKAWKQGP